MINILFWLIGLAPIMNLIFDYYTDSLMEPWKYILSILIGISFLLFVKLINKKESQSGE